MTRDHGIDISGNAEVNVAGNMISGDVNFHLSTPDISISELQSRLTKEREKIHEYEEEIEEFAYKGATQYHSSVVAIAKNAARTKVYIEGYIQEILNRGGDAKTTGHDLEIGVRLTEAFNKGGQRRIKEQKIREFKRNFILLMAGVSVILLLIKFAPSSVASTTGTSSPVSHPSLESKVDRLEESTAVSNSASNLSQTSTASSQQMQVTTAALNVRAEPHSNAVKIGKLFQKEVVVVEQQVSTEDGQWLLILREKTQKTPELKGWVNAEYLTPSNTQ